MQLTKHETLLLLACKSWDLEEFIKHTVENESEIMKNPNPVTKPLQLMMSDYWPLVQYYCIVYNTYLDSTLYTVVTRDLLELVTKLRPYYVNECVLNSIDLTKQVMLPEHNHLFQLLRNQISQLDADKYTVCKDQLPAKFIKRYKELI